MKFYITGTRRGLGKALSEKYNIVDNLNEADVFINCKHDGFSQVDLLYKAAELNKKIINIGSAASDWTKGYKDNFKYGIEKKTLREVNDQLFWEGIDEIPVLVDNGWILERVNSARFSLVPSCRGTEFILRRPSITNLELT